MGDSQEFRARYGPWALVAGASVGLGAEFARQLAARGLNLVLVARRAAPLGETAKAVSSEFGVEVRTLAGDLGRLDEVLPLLRERTADVEIGLLVYNAALGLIGRFLEQELEDKLAVVDLNCRGPVAMAHEFGRPMARRGRGGIILMSSLSGLQGTPLIATYCASKAFDTTLGEALWDELREEGIDVLSCVAGATRTPSFVDSNPKSTGLVSAPVMEPEPVVTQALAALGRQPTRITGRANRVIGLLMSRLLPRRLAVRTMGRTMRRMYEATD